jgi:hypothetical protein
MYENAKNGKPFRQYAPSNPLSPQGRWFRRHLVIDHRHKEIMIQIMWDGSGELKNQEYMDIKKGAWWDYVPEARVTEIRNAVASGYTILPIVVAGGNDGEDHVTMQLIDFVNTHRVIKDETLTPLPE